MQTTLRNEAIGEGVQTARNFELSEMSHQHDAPQPLGLTGTNSTFNSKAEEQGRGMVWVSNAACSRMQHAAGVACMHWRSSSSSNRERKGGLYMEGRNSRSWLRVCVGGHVSSSMQYCCQRCVATPRPSGQAALPPTAHGK